ncbi:ATPase, H transporting, lysosomal V1 subunit G3 (predicted), isoform CRA_b [Rattus norvegicus]|uniref:ATPase, H transporting, lysosomal V1 subunit G3 (Predicted), isoform CRA_b n=1 Tax=Rattus norvegicus TaxID=10116 RepID=A6ICK7_RAT|nr:ATPase, H transporting, lysosomal V1 subunit G3 (predicted), isoform CRA_b [Rattus norvegicus]
MAIRVSELDPELSGKHWQPWIPSGSVTPASRPFTYCKVRTRSNSSIVGWGRGVCLFVFLFLVKFSLYSSDCPDFTLWL